MLVCILCIDENVEVTRAKAREFIPELKDDNRLLSIPLSATGQLPVTHWFCFMNIEKDLFDKLKTLQEVTEIDAASPKIFLREYGLKSVKEVRDA